MSLTYSQPMTLGTKAPDFQLMDTISEKIISLHQLKPAPATVVMFMCNHCPYVQHIEKPLVQLAKEYQAKGVNFIGISANDIENFPADAPAEMKKRAQAQGYTFSYLYDETQEVAKAYQAQCTPEFYVFDKELNCAYHGRFDDATPKNSVPVTGHDLRAVLDAVLQGQPAPTPWHNSMGCNIKWK